MSQVTQVQRELNWNHEYHQANGIRIHVVRHGRGIPLIFIHGWPEYWRVWWKVIEPLAASGFEVVVMDYRGCGETEKPPLDDLIHYTLEQYASDIGGLADALGYDRFGIVCHGGGSHHAQSYARANSERLFGIFSFDTPYPGIGTRLADPRMMLETWYQSFNQMPWAAEMIGSTPKACELYLRKFLDHHAYRPGYFDGEIDQWVEMFLRPGNIQGGLNWYLSHHATRLRLMKEGAPTLSLITVPTCVRWGENNSLFLPEFADKLSEYFSDLDFALAPKAGHYVAFERPDYAVKEIRSFFQRLGAIGNSPSNA